MPHFYGVVQKDADSAFGVHFPDLPGCFSAADREEELVQKAQEALRLWFEDRPMVMPSPLAAIVDMAGEELVAGATLLAVSFD